MERHHQRLDSSQMTAEERMDLVRRNRKLTRLLGDEVVREGSHHARAASRSLSPAKAATRSQKEEEALRTSQPRLESPLLGQEVDDDAASLSTCSPLLLRRRSAVGPSSSPSTPLPPQVSAKAAAILGVASSPSAAATSRPALDCRPSEESNGSSSSSSITTATGVDPARPRRSLDSLQSRDSFSLSRDVLGTLPLRLSGNANEAKHHARAQSEHVPLGEVAAAHESWLDLERTLDADEIDTGSSAKRSSTDLIPGSHDDGGDAAQTSPNPARTERRRRVDKMTRWLGNPVPAHLVAPDGSNDAPAYMYDEAPLSASVFETINAKPKAKRRPLSMSATMGRTSSAPAGLLPMLAESGQETVLSSRERFERVRRANKLEQLLGEGAGLAQAQVQMEMFKAGRRSSLRVGRGGGGNLAKEMQNQLGLAPAIALGQGEQRRPRAGMDGRSSASSMTSEDDGNDDLDQEDDPNDDGNDDLETNDEHEARRRRAAKAQKLSKFFGQRVEQGQLLR